MNDKKLDDIIDHYESVATFCRLGGNPSGIHADTAEYLKRLRYYEEAIKTGQLVWKEGQARSENGTR